jgi:hypothetical protein
MSTTAPYIEWVYSHLPEFMRVDDATEQKLFLRRFLQPACAEMDGFEDKILTFYQLVDPDTSPIEWLRYWLNAIFKWSWFPDWFTDEQIRLFAKNVSRHYARRGRVEGIGELLAFFGAPVIVEARSYYWEDVAWGDDIWLTEPLVLVVRVLPGALLTEAEIYELLRFEWPFGHIVYIENLGATTTSPLDGLPLWGEGEPPAPAPLSPLDNQPVFGQPLFGEEPS